MAIEPWLAVSNGADAVDHYRAALGAIGTSRLEGDDGSVLVERLEIEGAAFWIQEDRGRRPAVEQAVRMIVSVADPDAWFARATSAGMTEIAGMHEEHGWRTGRVLDRFGHDWEFSRRADESPRPRRA
jgi:PhnB protein